MSAILSRLTAAGKRAFQRGGRRVLLAAAIVAVFSLIGVAGQVLPATIQPLAWYIPALDSIVAVTLLVVLILASTDVVVRRHGRLLPVAVASLALAMAWLAHGATFPGVLPLRLPLTSLQTASTLFHLTNVATPSLLVWVLQQPTHALAHPRRALARALAVTAIISWAVLMAVTVAARLLPPLIASGKYTELNSALSTLPFLAVAVAAATYRRGRNPERRIETTVLTALLLVTVEASTFMFVQGAYDGYWYLGHALLVLPYAALFVGVVRMLTAARREAEMQLRILETVKESQQRLQVIIDTSPSAVIAADERGFITGWNRKAEAMFGWTHDEAVGRTLTETIVPPRYREAHERGLARFVSTGQSRIEGRSVEMLARHKHGHDIPVELSVSATSRSGSQVSFVAFVNDISQRRAAERIRAVQFAVTRPLATAARWDDAASQVLQGIGETLACAVAEFWSVDKDAGVLRRQYGWYRPGRELASFQEATREVTISHGLGLVGRVWAHGRARSLDDVAAEKSAWAGLAVRAGLHGNFAFPVTNGREVTGVITLLSQRPRPVDKAALRVMTDIGSQIGHFIERRRAEEELRRSGDRIRAILDNVADGIITVDHRFMVRSYNPAAERLFGYPSEDVIGKEFARLISEPYRADVKPQLRSALTADQSEVVIGRQETYGRRQDGSEFPLEFKISRLGPQRLVIGSLRDVSEQKAETEALQFQALHDPLTGLPNRTLLNERLQETIRAGEREIKPCAVLLLDLDGFKQVNDALGHEAGDRLLLQVSQRMRAGLRKADTVARIGGDEFAIVPWGATDSARAVLIAEKLLQAIEKPFTIDQQPVDVTVSVGIAVFPQHGEDADTLMRRADVAMYAAKRAKSGFTVYSVDQEGGDNGQGVPLIGKLRYAIDQFELLLHYQPIVAAVEGKPVKVEALVRWGHPSHGLLPPDDFIPSAEQTDLIKPLTAWVLNEAIGQAHAWAKTGIDIGISVNLSARNLLDTELPDAVAQLLRTWQVPPEKLSLEITESLIIASEAEETLQRLHAIGVHISVDDFGTGYSSLAHLKRLPVREIKIDRSFVTDMATNWDGAAIVRSTIDLGHNLGLRVVAEGIEDERTATMLREYGCDYLQGFHISRPAAAGQLGPWLRAQFGLNGVVHGSLSA